MLIANKMNRKERILNFYNTKPSIGSGSFPIEELEYLAVGWRSGDSAKATYEAASSYPFHFCRNIKSILDIGSGLAGFLTFLRQCNKFEGRYLGVEILEEFDSYARRNFREDRMASFVCEDFLSLDFGGDTYDWAFSLGSLSVHQEEQDAEDMMTICKMASLSNFGFSIFLNDAEKCTSLKGHNIENFANRVQSIVPNCKDIRVDSFGERALPAKTMIHVLK